MAGRRCRRLESSVSARWAPGSRSSASRRASRRSAARSRAELGERPRGRIGHFLTRKVEKGQLEQAARDAAVARLTLTTGLDDLADCDLVIEAIVEELEPSGSSSPSSTGSAARTRCSRRTRRRSRSPRSPPRRPGPSVCVGMHFFNPAPLMPLVEVVRAELTDDDAVRDGLRVRRAHRQDADPLPRHARLRRQPHPDPAAERLRPRARRGARHARGPRHRHAARRRLADGPVRARRPRRHRHARARLRGAVREDPRAADGAAAAARRMRNAGLLGRKTGRGFYPYD